MAIQRIHEIDIHNFRCFKSISLKLGKYLTVIAGHNATGKSTILGLLGHCAELKKKDGQPILQNLFRTEFSEIIKASPEFDRKTSLAYTIEFISDGNSKLRLPFRATWYDQGRRFRLIPKKTTERSSEAKIEWPTLYLGLGRLYPLGESQQVKKSNIKLTSEEQTRLFKAHKDILNLIEDPISCTQIQIQETPKKTVGINTSSYDAFVNSAGQDNLNQILLAVMSFERLKKQRGAQWNGGILLIDELDATLHPSSQNKLVNYLYRQAKQIDMQIVFTTHSLSMLEHISNKCSNNNEKEFNNIEIVYLTNRNGYLERITNPSYDIIYNDLLNTIGISPMDSKKIPVYTEDEEARWFLRCLLGDYCYYIKLLSICIGAEELLKLLQEDPDYYKNVLFVLDGDIKANELKSVANKLGYYHLDIPPNVILLPGNERPEKVVFEYLNFIPGHHELFKKISNTGLNKRTLHEKGPNSFTEFAKERERYKAWMKSIKPLLDRIYEYWEKDNKEVANEFRQNFFDAYNTIAKKLRFQRIPQL